MTAVVAVMATSATSIMPKRHGFSIESLIGTPDTTSSSSPGPATPPRAVLRDAFQEKRYTERERDRQREREREKEALGYRERQRREVERDVELLREREMVLENLRLRDKEFRDIKDRSLSTEKEVRDFRDNPECRSSNPHMHRLSPRSTSPASPRTDKCLTGQSENRLGLWPGDEFKHLLGSLSVGQLDTNPLYQPLRVCNRALVSMGGIPAGTAPNLGLAMPPHFGHLQMGPLLYNLPRDIGHQPHPLLAARYPGFMNTRYQMGPPPGLLFHPYRKPKRNRTAFSPAQLLHLEQAFEKNHYVVGQERKALAAKLQLTETQVKVWFQNRRTKHKRMKAEEDGETSGSQVEGHEEKGHDRSDVAAYIDHEDGDEEEEDEPCSGEEEEEELSVTEEC